MSKLQSERLSLEEIGLFKGLSRKFDEIFRKREEEELKMWQLQMKALREAITTIKRKSEEKKYKFGKKALRKAITTIKEKSEEKKRNFVETVAYEPRKEKRFSVSAKLQHIAVRR